MEFVGFRGRSGHFGPQRVGPMGHVTDRDGGVASVCEVIGTTEYQLRHSDEPHTRQIQHIPVCGN